MDTRKTEEQDLFSQLPYELVQWIAFKAGHHAAVKLSKTSKFFHASLTGDDFIGRAFVFTEEDLENIFHVASNLLHDKGLALLKSGQRLPVTHSTPFDWNDIVDGLSRLSPGVYMLPDFALGVNAERQQWLQPSPKKAAIPTVAYRNDYHFLMAFNHIMACDELALPLRLLALQVFITKNNNNDFCLAFCKELTRIIQGDVLGALNAYLTKQYGEGLPSMQSQLITEINDSYKNHYKHRLYHTAGEAITYWVGQLSLLDPTLKPTKSNCITM